MMLSNLKDINSGDFLRIHFKGKTGVGYVYDNGDNETPWLVIGISWSDGGTSNSTIEDALEQGATFEKIIEAHSTWESKHTPFVDEWGNTDWRDVGEMRG